MTPSWIVTIIQSVEASIEGCWCRLLFLYMWSLYCHVLKFTKRRRDYRPCPPLRLETFLSILRKSAQKPVTCATVGLELARLLRPSLCTLSRLERQHKRRRTNGSPPPRRALLSRLITLCLCVVFPLSKSKHIIVWEMKRSISFTGSL